MSIIVDASVVVKWYVPELYWDNAQRVAAAGDELAAPVHVLGEVGAVLVRRFRQGKITDRQLAIARVAVRDMLSFISLTDLFDAAMQIAIETRLSFYDALYVAAAEREDTFVITADARLVRVVASSRWSDRVLPLSQWVAGPHAGT